MSYIDDVLARCQAATPGKWEVIRPISKQSYRNKIPKWLKVISRNSDLEVKLFTEITLEKKDPTPDAEFISHARTDCEELAKRLKRAIAEIKDISNTMDNSWSEVLNRLADELERPLGEEKK